MGSLKRKHAPPHSSSSSKRASRGDESSLASANGYTGGRRSAQNSAPVVDPSLKGASAAAGAGTGAKPPPDSRASTSGLPPSGPAPMDGDKRDPEQSSSKSADKDTPATANGSGQNGSPGDDAGCDGAADVVSQDNSGHLIPNHAGWFLWDKIHQIERKGVPEFFNLKSKLKTPTLYMEYRNIIMRKYWENPDKLLTWPEASTAITENKEGSRDAAKRIFDFLNHWGLINSRAFGNAKHGCPPKQKLEIDPSHGALVSSLYHFDSTGASSTARLSAVGEKATPTSAITEASIADLQGGVPGPSVEYHCNSCSADCSKRRFHCQKQADFDLCPECYNEGKFSFGITNTDFILMEAVTDSNETGSGGWSDQETLLLLEALELYGDNFSEIADHVATKTKAQCILHFIRLPIEDPFLDGLETSANLSGMQQATDSSSANKTANVVTQSDDQDGASKLQSAEVVQQKVPEDQILTSENTKHEDDVCDDDLQDQNSTARSALIAAAQLAGLRSSEKTIGISESGNPVMALVAFLAGLITPEVAARSADSARRVLTDQASALQLADKNSYNLEFDSARTDNGNVKEDRVVEEPSQKESQCTTKSTPTPCEDSNTCADEGKQSPEVTTADSGLSSLEKVQNAATTALAAAAVKAMFLAEQEESDILRLALSVVDSQCKKIEAKLKLFRDLDAVLQREHNMLEKSRQRLYAERAQMAASRGNQAALGMSAGLRISNAAQGAYTPVVASGPSDFGRGPASLHSKESQGPSAVAGKPPSLMTSPQQVAYPVELQRFTHGHPK